MHKHLFFLASALLCACSDPAPSSASTDEEESDFTCALGSLTGTWRITYAEQDGDCGPVPAETVSLGGSGGTDPGCTYAPKKPSADKCSLEFDFSCPTTDGKGSQRWTGITRQVAEKKLISDATAQVQHPDAGVCRSTYTMTWARL